MKPNTGSLKQFLVAQIVPIVFVIVCLIGVVFSGSNPAIILMDVAARFGRNAILVLSLILPILTGLGLNFGIVLGAMAGQAAIFCVCVAGMEGMPALLVSVAIALPLSILLGWLSGMLLNRTKGQEMITSMILGFFAAGVYQFIFLYFLGGVIPIDAPGIMIGSGVGVRNTIDLANMKYALDNLWKTDLFTAMMILGGFFLLCQLWRMFRSRGTGGTRRVILWLAVVLIGLAGQRIPALADYKNFVKIPMATYGLIALFCVLIPAFLRTKLGQEMRAVGQNMGVAGVAGIPVNRTRIIAICISTVLAALGQIVFLQNLGNLSTYNAHENVGMFSAAALLIGGASVSKATVWQALMGTLLFHLLFNVSPMAGKNLFGSAEIGEYFRVFIAYGIIAIALALYAWKKVMQHREHEKTA